MRKPFAAALLAGIFALSTVGSLLPSLPAHAQTAGDLNGDTVLNSADVRLLLCRLDGENSLSSEQEAVADVNGNGVINHLDVGTLCNRIFEAYETRFAVPTGTATGTAMGTTPIATATASGQSEKTTSVTEEERENSTSEKSSETTKKGEKTTKSTKKTTEETTEKPTKKTTKKTTTKKPSVKTTSQKTTKKTTAKTTKKTTAKTTKKTTTAPSEATAQKIPTMSAVLSPAYTPKLKSSAVAESSFMKNIRVVNSATGKVYTAETKEKLQLAVTADVKYEMGSSRFGAISTEAWKAHAVASYTRMCQVAQDGGTFTISMSKDVDLSSATDKKIYNAVGEVLGIKLMSGGSLCTVFYHASSAGTTSSCHKVFTQNLPYAQAVFAPETTALVEEYNSSSLTSTYTDSFDNILAAVGEYLDETVLYDTKSGYYPLYATEWDGAYVARTNLYYMSGGEKVYVKGTHIRSALGLRSHSFAVTSQSGSKLTLTVRGHGHGLGLSQIGAVIYASEYGWTYDQILAHYFSISSNSACQLYKPKW